MVGASKILTVSYGTFSCTLEGFDDPFDTMKAIAEYFRDLAADDRYFGAEPPTPDAAMLHRIAEREMSRRVEARVQDNGVILRATPDAAPMPQDGTARPATVTTATAFEPDEPVSLPTLSESVAVKLQRLRAAAYAAAGPVVDAEIAPAPVPAPAPEPAPEKAPEPAFASVEPSAFEALGDTADETEPDLTAAEAVAEDAASPEDLPGELETPAPEAEPEQAAPEAVAEDQAAASASETQDTPLSDPSEESSAAPEDEAAAQDDSFAAAPDAVAAPDDLAAAPVETAAFDAPDVAGIDEGMDVAPEAAQAEAVDAADADDAQDDDTDDMMARIAGLAHGQPLQLPLDAMVDDLPEAAPAAEADDLPEYLESTAAEPEAVLPETDLPAPVDVDEPQAFTHDATADDQPEAATAAVADDLPVEVAEEPARPMLDASDLFVDDEPLDFMRGAFDDDMPEAPAPLHDDAEALAAAAIAEIEGANRAAPEAMEADDARDALTDEEIEIEIEVVHATLIEVEVEDEADSAFEAAPETAAQDEAYDDDAAEAQPEPVADAQVEAAQAAAPEDAETAEPTSDVVAKIQRARARVIKIRRAEPVTEEAPEDEPSAAAAEAAEHATGSDTAEAEAALDRSLTALRGEPAVVQPQRPVRVINERDADVQRLIAQTNTEMEGPENRRRLSAIAHLKAAVAATFADRKAGGAETGESEDSRITPYRGDLERVVRPRRPVSGSGSTEAEKPAEAPVRPAPLMLLSEYRVDRPKPAEPATPQAPVWPRRAAASNLALSDDEDDDFEDDDSDADADADKANIFGSASGFARFAEKLGASELPDLLEAAAVYAAQVEGRPHLSRPQLLRQVQDALPEAAGSREDQLRAFGTLLRAGRIEKIKRGQFAAAESSHYLAEAQKIAR